MSGGSTPASAARRRPIASAASHASTTGLLPRAPTAWTRPSESMPRPASSWSPMVATRHSCGLPSMCGIGADERREHERRVPVPCRRSAAPLPCRHVRSRPRPDAGTHRAWGQRRRREPASSRHRGGHRRSCAPAARPWTRRSRRTPRSPWSRGTPAAWAGTRSGSSATPRRVRWPRSTAAAGRPPAPRLESAAAAGLTQMPERGPWTVTVPGAVDSWREAHDRFGRLPWADLLAPAIELADGFPASAGWVGAVERAAAIFGTDGDWARTYRPAWASLAPRRTRHACRRSAGPCVPSPPKARACCMTGALGRRAATYLEGAGSPIRARRPARRTGPTGARPSRPRIVA